MLIDTVNPSQVILQVQSVKADGSPDTALTSASVRVYHIAAGSEVEDLAATPLAHVGATSFWRYIWKPTALVVGHYFAEYTLVNLLAVTTISIEDVDIRDLATNTNLEIARYGGYVNIDEYYGSGGTAFPIGTREVPCFWVGDAKVIADSLGLRAYRLLGGDATLTEDHTGWLFEGGGSGSLIPNGFNITYSRLEAIKFCGVAAVNSLIAARNCIFWDGATNLAGAFVGCMFNDRFLFGPGSSILMDCAATTPSPARFYFQGNAVLVHFARFSGDMELHDLSYPSSAVSVEMLGGTIMIGASCTVGTIDVYGTGTVINNALGTVVTDHTINPLLSAITNDIGLVAVDVTTLKKIESGSWEIKNNQMIFYDTGGTTPLFTFDLFDENGIPTNTNVFKRVPI